MRDKNGHCTRFSDSSFYDEVCIYCGATDATGSYNLSCLCPIGSDVNRLNEWLGNHDDMGPEVKVSGR